MVMGNTAQSDGGGIYASGDVTVISSTISGNSISAGWLSFGGGIYANVLILGETGVGKTLFAQELHDLSERSDGPLIELIAEMAKASATGDPRFLAPARPVSRVVPTSACALVSGRTELR